MKRRKLGPAFRFEVVCVNPKTLKAHPWDNVLSAHTGWDYKKVFRRANRAASWQSKNHGSPCGVKVNETVVAVFRGGKAVGIFPE